MAEGIHQICDSYVEDYAELHPVEATGFGLAGHDDELTDYSPDGYAARAELGRRALAAVEAAEPADDGERVAQAVFAERIGLAVELHDAGLDKAQLNTIASPAHELRMAFDLMPTETPEHWQTIATRLAKLPAALSGYRTSLLAAADDGHEPALRQVAKVAEQCDVWAGLHGTSGFFQTLVAPASVDDALRRELEHHAHAAQEAYAEFAGFLRAELAPLARSKDAVGREEYQLWSRLFTGSELDLAEAYEWGWSEFAELEQEMREVGARVKPGASLAEVAATLDADPRYRVHGQDAFAAWMQQLSDDALSSLRGKHFEIPDEVMGLECRIAPPGGAIGAYYTHPAEDFSRPGRMWWSVPVDRVDFTTWREVSVVYHEGAPGHHLQIATGVYEQSLNRFQRLLSNTSGLAEGWALYAELLMRELGYLDDDGDLLGMLDGQLFRAARVIVDIGMHLELEIPAGFGFHDGERWTPELGLEFMLTRTITDAQHVHDEIDRYLGWPGQAPSYKIGERLWLAARADAERRVGAGFDLKDFHTRALRLGGMGLDTLRQQLAALS